MLTLKPGTALLPYDMNAHASRCAAALKWRQVLFVGALFTSDFCAAAAARAAGYAPKSAKVTGHRLLQREDVNDYIWAIRDLVAGRTEPTRYSRGPIIRWVVNAPEPIEL